MKKLVLLFLFAPLFLIAQFCDPNANVIIYSNYDGGVIDINIDEDIPNLKIGVVSYRAAEINLSGTYLSNVTDVVYAGYNDNSTSGSCPATNGGTTSINNAPAGANTSILNSPSGPNGNIICSYNCNTNPGSCSSSEDVQDFFLGQFNESTIYFHETQYGCWQNTTYSVSDGGNCCPPAGPLDADLVVDDVKCYEDCNGSITVNASGGEAPYTYNWIGSSETSQINEDLCPGNYEVEVTDNAGATETFSAEVLEPTELSVSIHDVSHPLCHGDNGQVNFTISGGTPVYTEDWGSLDPMNLPSGTHSFEVSDENDCSLEESVTINQAPDEMTYETGITEDGGDCTGGMSVDVDGGTPPYDYNWGNNASTSSSAIGLCGGEEYCVTVTDDNDCEIIICETIATLSTSNEIYGSTEIHLFPNPSDGVITLSIDVMENEQAGIILKNALGKEVASQEKQLQTGRNEITFEVPKSGVYFITVSLKDYTTTRKLVNK